VELLAGHEHIVPHHPLRAAADWSVLSTRSALDTKNR
jgi:hypothetical protein